MLSLSSVLFLPLRNLCFLAHGSLSLERPSPFFFPGETSDSFDGLKRIIFSEQTSRSDGARPVVPKDKLASVFDCSPRPSRFPNSIGPLARAPPPPPPLKLGVAPYDFSVKRISAHCRYSPSPPGRLEQYPRLVRISESPFGSLVGKFSSPLGLGLWCPECECLLSVFFSLHENS